MSDSEYKDLQSFGKTIAKKPENKTKECIKVNKKYFEKLKPVISNIKKITIILSIKFIKAIISFGDWTGKNIKKAKKHRIQLKKIKIIKHPWRKTCEIGYKIVETKKQHRNKIIITRRRVPIDYNPLELQSKKTDLGALFYLTFKDDSNTETKPEVYTQLKESILDFPTEKRRK